MPDDMEDIIQDFLVEARELLDNLDGDLVRLEEEPNNLELLNQIFRHAHTIKGNASFLGFMQLTEFTHKLESVLDKLRSGQMTVTPLIMDLILEGVDVMKKLLNNLDKDGQMDVSDTSTKLTAALKGDIEIPVPLSPSLKADDKTMKTEPAVIEPKPVIKKEEPSKPVEKSKQSSAPAAPAKKAEGSDADQTIRIEVERLDNLMDWVGELVIAKNRLLRLAGKIEEHLVNNPLSDDLIITTTQINYAITELHQAVLKTRMLPIKKVFSKFPRMVRDLARDTKKEVELNIKGEETELDKSVIEKISDPLVHIIRNAVDHGIEIPQQREEKGKPRKGTLKLSAAHEGNYIIIEIEDDGKGMNPSALRQKAFEKNVLTQEEADRLSDKESLNLIFAPGFSTAEVVSNISGRGVGMNVVKANIEQLGGIVDIDTKTGFGSIFKIKLPLTLAIIPALLVKVGAENFAIPLAYVMETNRICAKEIYTIDQKEVIELRENVISLLRLGDLFHITPLYPPVSRENGGGLNDKFYTIILGMGQQRIGILVDELLGQEDIVVKPLGEIFANASLVAGATIMGDGNVVLILDVNAILQYVLSRKKTAGAV